MPYTFIRDGVPEKVLPEKWRWVAKYRDNTILKQFGDDGIFHQFKEIDQSKLMAFQMVSPDSPQVFSIAFVPEEMKLIHFYRNPILAGGSPNERRLKFYVFGYEQKVHGHVAKSFFMITPDNELICTNDVDKIHFA